MTMTDNEDASGGMIVLFVIGLLVVTFIFILMGPVHDYALGVHDITGSMGDPFFVSDERIQALNYMETLWAVIPFLGIVLPLVTYAVIVSIRKQGGAV